MYLQLHIKHLDHLVLLFISLTLAVSSCLRPALTGTNQENAFLQIAAGGHFYDYLYHLHAAGAHIYMFLKCRRAHIYI